MRDPSTCECEHVGYYKDHFMNLTNDGFIKRTRYMDVYTPHSVHKAIGQLKVSFHQL